MDKVVVTAALTGVLANRDQCPAIPYTAEEIAIEAYRCREAGAAVVHIHAREEDGRPSFRAERYREIMEAVRSKCDIIINFSTGAIGIPLEERVAHLKLCRPEMAALNMGSMNYAIYSEAKKRFYFDEVFANPFRDIMYILQAMKESGVKPELECFDAGHVGNAYPLLDMGILEGSVQFSLIMGVTGGIQATPRSLVHQAGSLPPDATWQVIGISLAQWPMVAVALSLGGHVRVGLEDNFYVEKGRMARSNAELVEKAVRMARDVGREVAGVEEARRIFRLDRVQSRSGQNGGEAG